MLDRFDQAAATNVAHDASVEKLSLNIIDAGIMGLQAVDENGRTSFDCSFVPKY